jgi:hypothetical protein
MYAQCHVRRLRPCYREPSLLPKTTESGCSNTYTFHNVVAFVCAVQYITHEVQQRQFSGKWACVYDVSSVKNKIENETDLTDYTSNLT